MGDAGISHLISVFCIGKQLGKSPSLWQYDVGGSVGSHAWSVAVEWQDESYFSHAGLWPVYYTQQGSDCGILVFHITAQEQNKKITQEYADSDYMLCQEYTKVPRRQRILSGDTHSITTQLPNASPATRQQITHSTSSKSHKSRFWPTAPFNCSVVSKTNLLKAYFCTDTAYAEISPNMYTIFILIVVHWAWATPDRAWH